MKIVTVLFGLCHAVLFGLPAARAQAIATASGPGSNITVSGGISAFNTDYGHNDIAGAFAFIDTNPQWRVGLEGKARFLRWHASEQVMEADYLGGLRVVLSPRPARFSPYVKFLAGTSP